MLHIKQLKVMLQTMKFHIVYLLIFIHQIVASSAGGDGSPAGGDGSSAGGDGATVQPRERQLRNFNGKNYRKQ